MTDLATISDEWWHGSGGAEPVKMAQPDYYDEHRNIVKLLEDTGKSLLNEAKDQKNEATAMAKKLDAPNPFYHLRGGEFNLGHLDMLSRAGQALYGDLTPEKVVSGAVDAVQDLLKSPEEREKEKRQKAEEERIQAEKDERDAGKWSSYLSPFFHLSGGAIDKYLAMAKEFAKKAGYKDWDTLRRADDGEHKLELRGVKFGRKGYGDFIKYSLDEGVDEAQKHRSAYLARATNIKGDWAKDMYSPNSLAINILWDGKSSCPMSGGAKTEAELDAMSVVKLIEYGKSLGVKGLDGKTKKVIMDKIISHEANTPEVIAPKAEEGLTPLKLYKMLLMEGSLEKDLIPLAKKQKIERIMHKNKKTLVNEIYDNLLANEEIQATDSLENVPKVVMYLFGKGEDPYADDDEDEDDAISVDEYELGEDEGYDDPVTYMVEDLKDGMHWQDRRVFTPTGVVLGTLGEKKFEDLVEAYGLDRDEYTSARIANIKVAPPAPPAPAPVTTTTTTTTTSAPTIEDPLSRLKAFRYNPMADAEIEQYEAMAKMTGKPIEGFLTAPLLQYYKSRPSRSALRPITVQTHGLGRPYTAEEWEQKLCKGENSLLAQKKQKIKERAEKQKPKPKIKIVRRVVDEETPPKQPKTQLEENKEMRDRTIESLKKHEAEADRLYKEINDDSWGFSPEGARQKRELKNDWSEERSIIVRLKREIEWWNEAIRNAEVKGSGRKPVLAPQEVLEGKKDNPMVEETIEEPMDDTDIRQYLPNAKVMRYSGLARLSDIEQLLPTDKSYVILLYENTPGSGHWVALMRYGRTIEFFCSYGSKIDAPLRWQNPRDNAMLGQTKPFLSLLLNKAKGKFRAIHNPVAYQSSKQGVATCGAWDVMRINQMKNHNQDLHEFHDFMESVKKETGLTYDEIVVNYVSKR